MKATDDAVIKRIHDAVDGFLSRDSPLAWSMDDLALKGGVSKRTLYKIVSSKEKVVAEVLEGRMMLVQRRVGERLSSAGSRREALRALLDEFPDLIPSLLLDSFGPIAREYPSIEASLVDRREKIAGELLRFLEEARREGVLRDSADPALVLETLQALLIHFTKRNTGDRNPRRRLASAFGFVFDGILTPPPEGDGSRGPGKPAAARQERRHR